MAITRTFGDALNLVYATTKRAYEEAMGYEACNFATQWIWNQADWRGALVEFAPFWLIPNEQDHGKPTFTVPTDYNGLRECFVVNLQGTTPIKSPLEVQYNIERTANMGIPTHIAYIPSLVTFRLWPRVPSGIAVPYWLVEGSYKKVSPQITASTLNSTTLPWDDQYFMNYITVLKWALMDLSGDPRAGQVQYQKNGRYAYTGQLAAAAAAVADMMSQEGFNLGESAIAPAESFVGGASRGSQYW